MLDVQGPWPLIGRGAEMERMQRAAPNCRALALVGEPGVGKTRLALHFLDSLEQAGAVAVRLTGTHSTSSIPFGAFAHLLPALDSGASSRRADLYRRCVDGLLALANGRRLVVMADDAHLLDEASASLLRQMMFTRAAFVLATMRTGECVSDAVVALWKDDEVERIDVTGLGTEDIGRLLVAALGGPVDRATVNRLVAACQSNVLYLRELVFGALEDGALRRDIGIWRLTGSIALSRRLVELVENRLVGLDEEERRLLEVIALGEPLGTAELDAFGSRYLADRLERAGLVASRTDGRVLELRLAHPIYAEVLREQTPAVRAQVLMQELADVLESTGTHRSEDLLRVATWRLAGGNVDPERTLAAAFIARWRYDFSLAEQLARRAVLAGAGFEAKLLAAQLAGLSGRVGEADADLISLTAEARHEHQLARATMALLDNQVFHRGGFEEGLRIAAAAEARIEDPVWRDELSARRAGIMGCTHGPSAAVEIAEPILARGSDRAVAWAAIAITPSLAKLGRIDDALRSSTIGYEAHVRLREPLDWYPWTHLALRGEVLAQAGRLGEAHAIAMEQYEQAAIDRSPEGQAWFARLIARTVSDRGHPRTAAMYARVAVSLFRELGRPRFEHSAVGHLITALALSGDAQAASDIVRTLDAVVEPDRYSAVDVKQAKAWTEVAGGNIPAACRLLKEAAELGAEIGDHTGEASALHGLARLGQADLVADQLAVLSEQIEGVLVQERARHAQALASQDPIILEAASRAFEAMGAHLLAAEAAADSAVAWTGRADPRNVAKATHRAHLLAGLAQDPVTPSLMAVKARSQLTRSEHKTALMASAGHSNREIAMAFVISIRTVENQLQRVYQKLGVGGRKELADAFRVMD